MGREWKSMWCACNYPRNSFWQFILQEYSKTKGDLGALPALHSERCFPEQRAQALIPGRVRQQHAVPGEQSKAGGERGRHNLPCRRRWMSNACPFTLLAVWACRQSFPWQGEGDRGRGVQWYGKGWPFRNSSTLPPTLYILLTAELNRKRTM